MVIFDLGVMLTLQILHNQLEGKGGSCSFPEGPNPPGAFRCYPQL